MSEPKQDEEGICVHIGKQIQTGVRIQARQGGFLHNTVDQCQVSDINEGGRGGIRRVGGESDSSGKWAIYSRIDQINKYIREKGTMFFTVRS